MASNGAVLPTRFPCWCRAIYSWGGESDKDLGFIEGDLIECLNAGDGSWWMGRLRRDKRMMGLFPSNFVTVLEENFVPISRAASPMPEPEQNDTSRNSAARLEKKKEIAKSRRPFQGYKTVVPTKTVSASSNATQFTMPQPAPRQHNYEPANPPSTVLWQQKRPVSRGPSRSPSPMPQYEIRSSPPPPPPPHRLLGGASRPQSPQPQTYNIDHEYQLVSRTPSPAAMSMNGHTPPMIRNAMDDVMSSLDDMGLGSQAAQQEPEEPFNPWSPDAFEDLNSNVTRHPLRPVTSLGLNGSRSQFVDSRPSYSSRHNSPDRFVDGPAPLETYVERMEKQLRARAEARQGIDHGDDGSAPPEPPPKNSPWSAAGSAIGRTLSMRRRKSAYDIGNHSLSRTYTTKTNSTNSSSGVQSDATSVSNQSSRTSQSIMSGHSAGGFSATSAGSLARHHMKMGQAQDGMDIRPKTSSGVREDMWAIESRPTMPGTRTSFRSGNDSRIGADSATGWSSGSLQSTAGDLGGFTTPKAKRTGLWKKLADGGRTAFASARSTIVPNTSDGSRAGSPTKGLMSKNFTNPITGIAGGSAVGFASNRERKSATSTGSYGRNAAREMGLMSGSGGNPWVMSRRDVNRSNTPGPSERQERAERCQMLNEPVIFPVEELYESTQGDEGADGAPVNDPFQISNPSFSLVDKAARFITSLPSSINAASLATGYVCRPYRSDVQKLRAIFTWCSERVRWQDDSFDYYNHQAYVDTRRVVQSQKGSDREVAHLVLEMCHAIGLQAEVVHGYLKNPGEEMDLDVATASRANHFWNTVLVDDEWRMIDASLASPTNPKRLKYSAINPSVAEAWYFLSKPSELCWTHVPVSHEQQHMVPAVSPDILLALPSACPQFFRMGLGVHNYDTSVLRLDGLEISTISFTTPLDVEVVAEVEAKAYLTDQDGDIYENTDHVSKMRVLAQPTWYQISPTNAEMLQKRFVVKALLPGDERSGILKIYAGKKGLMQSAREIVHPLALAIPLYHTGENPPYEFVRRHPTPHATRQDLYVVQPQCFNLAAGETYVFCVRQHSAAPSSQLTPTSEQNGFDLNGSGRPVSPNPFARPNSALSMMSSVAGGGGSGGTPSIQGSESSSVVPGTSGGVKIKDKPAKLAVQSPGGKIIRLTRKHEGLPQSQASKDIDGIVVGSVWEAIVKVNERGLWRGLVLADRSARWCVWGEWSCS